MSVRDWECGNCHKKAGAPDYAGKISQFVRGGEFPSDMVKCDLCGALTLMVFEGYTNKKIAVVTITTEGANDANRK